MQWVLWMIAVAVLGLAAVAASGRLGELPGTVTNTPRPHLPAGAMAGDALRSVRFAVAPRGYSMDQVDELLDRLSRQLDAASTTQPPAAGTAPGEPGPAADAARPDSGSRSADPGTPPPWSRESDDPRA